MNPIGILSPLLLNVLGGAMALFGWVGRDARQKKIEMHTDSIAAIRNSMEHFNVLIAAHARLLNAPDIGDEEKRALGMAVRLYKAVITASEERLQVIKVELDTLQAEFEAEGKRVSDVSTILRKRETLADDREAALDGRAAGLDAREEALKALDAREADISARELALACASRLMRDAAARNAVFDRKARKKSRKKPAR